MAENKKSSIKAWFYLLGIAITLGIFVAYLNCNQKTKPIAAPNDQKINDLISIIHSQDVVIQNLNAQMYQYTDSMNHVNSGLRNRIAALTMKISTDDKDSVTLINRIDTIYIKQDSFTMIANDSIFDFMDSTEFLSLSGVIDLKNKRMDYQYRYVATYTVLASYDINNIFKKPRLNVKILSTDENAHIDAELFQFKAKQPFLDVGLGVGYGIGYTQKKVVFLPSIQLSLYKKLFSIYR